MKQSSVLDISKKLIAIVVFIFLASTLFAQQVRQALIQGSVKDEKARPVEYAVVYIKETQEKTYSDLTGDFQLKIQPGSYTLCVQLVGFHTYEQKIAVKAGESPSFPVVLTEKAYALQEVVVHSQSAVQRINESAFNAVALDARLQHNSNATLSGILNKASGVRIRESGGVGSDMQVMMDGFSGKHIKVFIDGVPQDGVGHSFGLNNIPINFAERIEVYKGVVPVEFGTDAMGGVINIVTKKGYDKNWKLDASYSYGSFNTHKSYINYGQSFKNGLIYEINAFQNYSDNSYYVDTSVKEFLADGGSSTNKTKIERVKRFHDNYHNEVVAGKLGVINKQWADRLMFGMTYSRLYDEMQNGVRQDIVFGGKYRQAYSVMPSLEYLKRDFLTDGLNLTLTANYNRNNLQNVDTSSFEYNWRGEKRPRRGMSGEQSYMHLQSVNDNWNTTLSARYLLNENHSFTFNNVISSFNRSNKSLLTPGASADPIPKLTYKNVAGLSYQIRPSKKWNASFFGKYYYQHVAGPVATTVALDDIVRVSKSTSNTGYGAAATYFIFENLQTKLSYEKVYRLPSVNEMFGDEDLETGDMAIKAENSDNINVSLTYDESFGKHGVNLEAGFIYRDIKDYIQRNITGLSGGKYGAAFVNHGKVLTKGLNFTARYTYSNLLSVGGNFSEINTRDNVALLITGAPSNTYKARMPNVPYLFSNTDFTIHKHNFGAKGNVLTFSYDNYFVKGFPLYSEALGSSGKSIVPTQFSHDVSLAYVMHNGRYNISFVCQNLTDAMLYDNYSLQKAGRAFYTKFRVSM